MAFLVNQLNSPGAAGMDSFRGEIIGDQRANSARTHWDCWAHRPPFHLARLLLHLVIDDTYPAAPAAFRSRGILSASDFNV